MRSLRILKIRSCFFRPVYSAMPSSLAISCSSATVIFCRSVSAVPPLDLLVALLFGDVFLALRAFGDGHAAGLAVPLLGSAFALASGRPDPPPAPGDRPGTEPRPAGLPRSRVPPAFPPGLSATSCFSDGLRCYSSKTFLFLVRPTLAIGFETSLAFSLDTSTCHHVRT